MRTLDNIRFIRKFQTNITRWFITLQGDGGFLTLETKRMEDGKYKVNWFASYKALPMKCHFEVDADTEGEALNFMEHVTETLSELIKGIKLEYEN